MKTTTTGTVLSVESPTTPGTYVPVGNLTNIPVPGPTKNDIDVTDFDSTAMEYLPGLPDNGEMPITGWYNDANAGQQVLYDDAHDPGASTRNFRVDFTNQDVRFQFAAYVKSFVPQAGGVNEAYRFEGALRISGGVTKTTIP